MRRSVRGIVFAALTALVGVTPAFAGPETAGVRVVPGHVGEETQPVLVPDGEGGVFVGFIGEGGTLYTTRLRSDATPLPGWTLVPLGNLRINSPSGTRIAVVRPGVVVGFGDQFFTTETYYWLRPFTSTGPTFPDSSRSGVTNHQGPALVSRPGGGVLAIAPEANASSIAQFGTAVLSTDLTLVEDVRFNVAGSLAMVPVSQRLLRAIPDGSGGAWGVTQVADNSNPLYRDLVAARVNSDGTAALGGTTSRVVSTAARDQKDQQLASDGAGGLLIAWHDTRSATTVDDIYAMRLLTDGTLATGWTAGGKAICAQTGPQLQPTIATDGAGGAWIAWTDGRTGENDIFFTHILANGTLAAGFVIGGRALCAAPGGQAEPKIAADGAGGVFALWLDIRDGEQDLYAQHIAADGSVFAGWAEGGLPVCTDPTIQSAGRILTMSPNSALAVWVDTRSGTKLLYTALLTDQVVGVPPRASARLSLRPASVPARGAIELRLAADDPDPVEITLLDVSGRLVASTRVVRPAGDEVVRFSAEDLRPGVYLARASRAGAGVDCRVILLR